MFRPAFFSRGMAPVLLAVASAAAFHSGIATPIGPRGRVAQAQPLTSQSSLQSPDRRAPATQDARVVSRTTPHLAFSAALSPTVIVPGTRMSIVVDVTPKQGMHVYAPGTQYRPVAIVLQPHPLLRVHDPVYPKPTLYVFKPLNEEVLVYAAPFRMVVDITAGETAAQHAQLRTGSRLVIKGQLEYQACDETVCYLPASVPFQWTVRVKR